VWSLFARIVILFQNVFLSWWSFPTNYISNTSDTFSPLTSPILISSSSSLFASLLSSFVLSSIFASLLSSFVLDITLFYSWIRYNIYSSIFSIRYDSLITHSSIRYYILHPSILLITLFSTINQRSSCHPRFSSTLGCYIAKRIIHIYTYLDPSNLTNFQDSYPLFDH